MVQQLRLRVNANDKFHSISEEDYIQKLKQYMDYDESDELYIELLAFQETLTEAHQLLQKGQNVILTYAMDNRKKIILDHYRKRHEDIIFTAVN